MPLKTQSLIGNVQIMGYLKIFACKKMTSRAILWPCPKSYFKICHA